MFLVDASNGYPYFSHNAGWIRLAQASETYTNSDVDTHLNQSNPTSGYVLSWNGSDYAWVEQSGGDVVDDTSPQLGGNLDGNSFDIRLDNNDKYQWGQTAAATYIKGNSSSTHENSNIQFFLQSGSNSSGAAMYVQSTGLFMPTATDIRLEGPTNTTYEIVLAPTDPTANRTITIPDATGTVITTGNLTEITNLGVLTGGIVF